jgi:hypothetical protein
MEVIRRLRDKRYGAAVIRNCTHMDYLNWGTGKQAWTDGRNIQKKKTVIINGAGIFTKGPRRTIWAGTLFVEQAGS